MKRLLVFVTLASLFLVSVSGQAVSLDLLPASEDLQDSVSRYIYLDLLSERGGYLDSGVQDKMKEMAITLPDFFKQTLYERHSKNAMAGATTNLFTGGIGSLIMGDWLMGSVLTLSGLGTLTASVLMISGVSMSQGMRNSIAYAGITVTAIGVSWPFFYAWRRNSRLAKALALSE